jgi:hypothetical protein
MYIVLTGGDQRYTTWYVPILDGVRLLTRRSLNHLPVSALERLPPKVLLFCKPVHAKLSGLRAGRALSS